MRCSRKSLSILATMILILPVMEACGKKSKSKTTPAATYAIGYPDLSNMDELNYSADVTPEASCYTHSWMRLLFPKELEITDISSAKKAYIELKSVTGCQALIPLNFVQSSNTVLLDFPNAIMKVTCNDPDLNPADADAIAFNYISGISDKREFMMELKNPAEYCRPQDEDRVRFTD